MNTVDILTKARERIADPGKWYQGNYRDESKASSDECAVCAVGAICWAISGDPEDDGTHAVPAYRFLMPGYTLGESSVADWNDDPARTHDEVLAAFDKAIELAKASS